MVTQGKTSEWKIESKRERERERERGIVCEVGQSELDWSWVSSHLSLQQLLNQKLTVDPKAGWGLALHTHTHTHTHTQAQFFSLSLSRQVDGVVLARLQGSSLTPFEPMSQDNSRRFQSYCQRFPPSAFPRIRLLAVRDRNRNVTHGRINVIPTPTWIYYGGIHSHTVKRRWCFLKGAWSQRYHKFEERKKKLTTSGILDLNVSFSVNSIKL